MKMKKAICHLEILQGLSGMTIRDGGNAGNAGAVSSTS